MDWMAAAEEDLLPYLGITADELHRRCEAGGVTRAAWQMLGRAAERLGVLSARRQCLTCFREQWVIPLLELPAGSGKGA
ncbi:MAG TPA: hypothetical protein VG796_03995 [Verrucomicrobiales bacterium]|jgi:hypothetical protein|nr:hypothetical protein [Verrucomicrobiales bacterium]